MDGAGESTTMKETARKAAVATLVAGSIIVVALALWKMRLVLALLFSAFIIAAAIRPSIEWLARHRIPRGVGLALHYLVLLGLIALALSFVVPSALHQVNRALSPSGKAEIAHATRSSSGLKHQILAALQKRLKHLPSGSRLVKLVGTLSGVFRSVGGIGRLTARPLAVAVGFAASIHVAVAAAICVLIVRVLAYYFLLPKVLGAAVRLSPLLVLVPVTTVGILFSR